MGFVGAPVGSLARRGTVLNCSALRTSLDGRGAVADYAAAGGGGRLGSGGVRHVQGWEREERVCLRGGSFYSLSVSRIIGRMTLFLLVIIDFRGVLAAW